MNHYFETTIVATSNQTGLVQPCKNLTLSALFKMCTQKQNSNTPYNNTAVDWGKNCLAILWQISSSKIEKKIGRKDKLFQKSIEFRLEM